VGHIPVLAAEAVAALELRPDGRYVDATFGAGGHSARLLAALGPSGRLVAIDADPGARARALDDPRFTLVHANFRDLASVLDDLSLPQIDGVLYDLGVSSMQFDEGERGFSYREAAALDMRLDPTRGESAADFIARVDETELADAIFRYGDERASRRIARAIKARAPRDTVELAAVVAGAVHVRGKRERIHPATRTFQALRIAVNDELGALETSLDAALDRTREDGRIAVISFHSLEDRIVKQFMRRHASTDPVYAGLPFVPAHARPTLKLVGKSIEADAEETARNPRARSARLRVAERLTGELAA
jgi:16S rRNA (cytosine1402-N4)-methyltransferase